MNLQSWNQLQMSKDIWRCRWSWWSRAECMHGSSGERHQSLLAEGLCTKRIMAGDFALNCKIASYAWRWAWKVVWGSGEETWWWNWWDFWKVRMRFLQHSDVQLSTMILPAWVGKQTLPESSFAVQACFIVRHCIAFSSVKSSCRTIALADLQLLRRTQTHELMLVKCEA